MRRNASVILMRWALLGFVSLLVLPWLVPSNKLYHQLIIVLLWLPALIALGVASLRPRLPRMDSLTYLAFACWTLLVLAVRGGEEPLSEAKVVFYVGLSLLGILLAARVGDLWFERALLLAAMVGGLGAGLSWVSFYWGEGMPLSARVMALGLWNTIIMAAHAVGALAVLGVALVLQRPWRRIWWLPIMLAVVGYLLFLISSQTRGVWLALMAASAVILIAMPLRTRIAVVATLLIAIGALALYDPNLFLQRGVSYRPALWQGGIQLLVEYPLFGLGFHDFNLAVPGLVRLFKHPHNLFLDTGIRLGVFGLLLFLIVWLQAFWRAWQARDQALGRALLALWVFSTVSLMTDGIGLWLKPNADWLITWLPVALGMVLAQRRALALDAAAHNLRE